MVPSEILSNKLKVLKRFNSHFIQKEEARVILQRKNNPLVCVSILPDERFSRPSLVHYLLALKLKDCLSIGAKCVILFLDYSANAAKTTDENIDQIVSDNRKFFRALLDNGNDITFENESDIIKNRNLLEGYYKSFYDLIACIQIKDLLNEDQKIGLQNDLIEPLFCVSILKVKTDVDILITSEHLHLDWILSRKLSQRVCGREPPIFLVTPSIPNLDYSSTLLESDPTSIVFLDDSEDEIHRKLSRANPVAVSKIVEIFELDKQVGNHKTNTTENKLRVIDMICDIGHNFKEALRGLQEASYINKEPVIFNVNIDNFEVIKTLDSDIRMKIMKELVNGHRHQYALAKKLERSAPNIGVHLNQLEKANLISKIRNSSPNRKGKRIEYKPASEKIIIEFDLTKKQLNSK